MEQVKTNAAAMRSEFYAGVSASRRLDNSFATPSDRDLTREEIRQIDEYWGKYRFAYPDIDYKSFKSFKNRCGHFDVRHCPGAIRTQYFNKFWLNSDYSVALQNKGLLPLLFSNVKQPRTVLRRMNGMFSDENYTPLSSEDAVSLLLKVSLSRKLIMKASNLGGGRGIFFLDQTTTRAAIENTIRSIGRSAFVVQEFMEQSSFMKRFNPSCVNTLRVTSLIWKGKVRVLAALIRIGKEGNQVDNYSQGGSLLGVDLETGICNNWALTHDNERITVLPSGLNLSKTLEVPGFRKVLKCVCDMHARIPYIRMVSWDIALDKRNEPVLIENNFAGMIQIHEAVTGPLFGELMDELLDTYLLKSFSIEFQAGDYTCAEFHDHVEIVDYAGGNHEIRIPERLEKKPVTRIQAAAFRKIKLDQITVSETVAKNSAAALKRVKEVIIEPRKAVKR